MRCLSAVLLYLSCNPSLDEINRWLAAVTRGQEERELTGGTPREEWNWFRHERKDRLQPSLGIGLDFVRIGNSLSA